MLREWPAMRGRQIVLPERKLAFFTVPKCASMSIAATIEREMKKEWGRLQLHFPMTPMLWKGWQDYTRLAVLRCPYERFLSAASFMSKGTCRLDLFLDMACSTPDHEVDQHFQSQSRYLMLDGLLIPNRIIRFERLVEEWGDFAAQHWPEVAEIMHRNKSPRGDELTDEQKDRLRHRYAADFDLLETI